MDYCKSAKKSLSGKVTTLEISGKIIELLPEKSGQSANGEWRKREFILETEAQKDRPSKGKRRLATCSATDAGEKAATQKTEVENKMTAQHGEAPC